MRSLKGMSAVLAVGALVFAACGADTGEQQPFTPAPAETPAQPGNGEMTPGPGNGEMTPEPGTNGETTNDMTPAPGTNGETPAPGTNDETPAETPVGQEEPAETPVGQEEPTDEQPVSEQPGTANGAEAMAVIDHAGQLVVLTGGQCTWTEGQAGTVAGQPGDGSVIQLTFDGQPGTDQPTEQPTEEPTESPDPAATPGTDTETPAPGTEQPGTGQQGTLDLSVELARGFAPPAEEEPTGEQVDRPLSSEDVLPFIVQRNQVELNVQLEGHDLADPQVWTGTVAPNGLSGYIVAVDENQQLLTVNYLCATSPQDDAGMPGDDGEQPTETPAIDDENGTESPAPSP